MIAHDRIPAIGRRKALYEERGMNELAGIIVTCGLVALFVLWCRGSFDKFLRCESDEDK